MDISSAISDPLPYATQEGEQEDRLTPDQRSWYNIFCQETAGHEHLLSMQDSRISRLIPLERWWNEHRAPSVGERLEDLMHVRNGIEKALVAIISISRLPELFPVLSLSSVYFDTVDSLNPLIAVDPRTLEECDLQKTYVNTERLTTAIWLKRPLEDTFFRQSTADFFRALCEEVSALDEPYDFLNLASFMLFMRAQTADDAPVLMRIFKEHKRSTLWACPSVLPPDCEEFTRDLTLALDTLQLASGQAHSESPWPGHELNCLIGRGSYGAVYRLNTDRNFVVKVQNPDDKKSGSYLSYCFHSAMEMIALRATTHIPGIIHATQISIQDQTVFITLPYMEHNLYKLVRRDDYSTAIDVSTRIDLLKTVIRVCLDVLVALAEAGLVHGDLHPCNMLVSEHGVVKISDLGFTRRFDGLLGKMREPAVPAVWRPYELWTENEEQQPLRPEADRYGAGVTFLFMLSAATLISSKATYASFRKRVNRRDYPRPYIETLSGGKSAWTASKDFSTDFVERVLTITAGLMAKKPQDRWSPEHCLTEIEPML